MNKEIKEKWLEALRSGRYEQGKSYLRTDNRFCCLGVLCDLIAPDNWKEDYNCYSMEGLNACLPENIQQISGITSFGDLPNGKNSLVYFNDIGTSFKQIADIIEEQF